MATTKKKEWASEEPVYRQIGVRRIMNTEWPVENKVVRSGPRRWTVYHLLCNGAWADMRLFASRKAAYADAGITED